MSLRLPPSFRLGLWAAAIVGGLLVYFIGRHAGRAAAEAEHATADARAWLDGIHAAHALALRLQAVQLTQAAAARAHRETQRRLEATADSARHVADSLRDARAAELAVAGVPGPAALDSALTTLPAWADRFARSILGENRALRSAVDSLTLAASEARLAARADSLGLQAASQRALAAEARADDAAWRIRQLLAVRECRIPVFGWRCPSRTVTFLAGALALEGAHLAAGRP